MHRATPTATAMRSFTAGGARSVVHSADDNHFMQESKAGFMQGEQREGIESPQNYGFTSVVADAEMDGDGNITGCAEAFITFFGGNRTAAVAGVMDDRRHRLMGLEKGDTAMFRQRDDSQQFHMTKDGGYWSAPQGDKKTVRMQLVDKQQQQQQGGQGQGGGQQRDASGGGNGGGSGGAGSTGAGGKQLGQKPVYKNGKDSYRYVDVTDDMTRVSGKESHMMLEDKDSYVHCLNKKTYLGGNAGKHQFARVLTEDGPAANVYGRVDGSGRAEFADDVPKLVVFDGESQTRVGQTLGGNFLAPTIVPILTLLLGLSIGVNWSLISESFAGSALASACRMVVASR